MREELFNDLVDSIKEAGAWLRGETDVPEDNVRFVGEPDPRAIRAREGLSQAEFAAALRISVKTLQNWEQGRRVPTGPAYRLLQVADKHPEVLLELARTEQ